jgi:hypothetical protein
MSGHGGDVAILADMAGERPWRIGYRVVLGVAALLTLLCVLVFLGALRNDRTIGDNLGTATAEVDSVSWDRTIIRFVTPDGVVHTPQNGVLYPGGLNEGDIVRIEYATTEPDLARVAGRDASLALLPLGTTILFTWLVTAPLLWWIRTHRLQRRIPAPGVQSSR